MKFIASSKGSRKHPGGQLVERGKKQGRKNTSKSLQFQREEEIRDASRSVANDFSGPFSKNVKLSVRHIILN